MQHLLARTRLELSIQGRSAANFYNGTAQKPGRKNKKRFHFAFACLRVSAVSSMHLGSAYRYFVPNSPNDRAAWLCTFPMVEPSLQQGLYLRINHRGSCYMAKGNKFSALARPARIHIVSRVGTFFFAFGIQAPKARALLLYILIKIMFGDMPRQGELGLVWRTITVFIDGSTVDDPTVCREWSLSSRAPETQRSS